MKQYFGDVVSLPTHSNYCPLSHESSPNHRIQGSEDECVLGARPDVQFILLYIFRLCTKATSSAWQLTKCQYGQKLMLHFKSLHLPSASQNTVSQWMHPKLVNKLVSNLTHIPDSILILNITEWKKRRFAKSCCIFPVWKNPGKVWKNWSGSSGGLKRSNYINV